MKKILTIMAVLVMSFAVQASESEIENELFEVAYVNTDYTWSPDSVETGIVKVATDSHSFE